ncbi:MAG: hypothetical protein JSW54_06090, partial [Fidelibacterota bacterium]
LLLFRDSLMSHIFILKPAVFAVLLCTALPAQQITSLALLDFDARGIAAHEVATLTDLLRMEIVNIGAVPLVERGDMMTAITTEQDRQLMGCTSDECAIKIGNILGVSHIVAGSMGKVGSTYMILARVIDVETSQVVNTAKLQYSGSIEALLTRMTPLAYDVIGMGEELKRREREEREAAELARRQEEQRRRAEEERLARQRREEERRREEQTRATTQTKSSSSGSDQSCVAAMGYGACALITLGALTGDGKMIVLGILMILAVDFL